MSVVDLHVHSTASDGAVPPAAVVRRAADAGLSAIALTDHDTIAGLPEAVAAGRELRVRVVTGCEFSVAARWGEMHLLGYFLPVDAPALDGFLADQRGKRRSRAVAIVARLHRAGVGVSVDDVLEQANGGAIGRPHVARALMARGVVADISSAFLKYLGRGRPAFVPKQLPSVADVTELVRRVGGVTSAAHLKGRAVRPILQRLQAQGVDGVEALHPAHDPLTAGSIVKLAGELGLLVTGGSDWHGDSEDAGRPALGSLNVPATWLDGLEEASRARGGVSAGD